MKQVKIMNSTKSKQNKAKSKRHFFTVLSSLIICFCVVMVGMFCWTNDSVTASAETGTNQNRYLIMIKTADNEVASSVGTKPTVSFTYNTTTGKSRQTIEYDIKNEMGKFYFDEVDVSRVLSKTSDNAKKICDGTLNKNIELSSGKWVYFIIEVNGVQDFTSATFTLNGTDEWQIDTMSIIPLSLLFSIGKYTINAPKYYDYPNKTWQPNILSAIQYKNADNKNESVYVCPVSLDFDLKTVGQDWGAGMYVLSPDGLFAKGGIFEEVYNYFTRFGIYQDTYQRVSDRFDDGGNTVYYASLTKISTYDKMQKQKKRTIDKLIGTGSNVVYFDANNDSVSNDEEYGICIDSDGVTTYEFFTKSSSQATASRWDRSATKIVMDESIATSNLPFREKHYNFEVDVEVNGKTINADDATSKNYFYFKLVFENGTSAYVQANQQLQGDGFNTGHNTFNIAVNQDYGDLQGIQILPENSTTYGSPYDKLSIEKITVRNMNDQGIAGSWTFDDVGWVGIDYQEESSSKTHEESELAKYCSVSEYKNSITLQFAITTSASSQNEACNVEGELYYISSETGQEVSTGKVDLSEKIKEFTNNSKYYNSQHTRYLTEGALLNETVFRPSTTYRFLWEVDDISEVTKLNLTCYISSSDTNKIIIADIGVSLVQATGSMQKAITAKGEYVLENAQLLQVASLTEDMKQSESKRTINFEGNNTPSNTFDFYADVKDISNRISKEATIYKIEKIPTSSATSVNVTIVGSSVKNAPDDLTAQINYKDSQGAPMIVRKRIPTSKNVSIAGKKVYQLSGISLSKYSTLDVNGTVEFVNTNSSYSVDYVLLEIVKGDTIIETYMCDFSDYADISKGLPSDSTKLMGNTEEYQMIYLLLGDNSDDGKTLISEQYDIALAMYYTDAVTGNKFRTSNTFLTECGITTIPSGKLLAIKTNYYNISDIKSLVIGTIGGLNIEVKDYAIGVYRKVDGKDQCTQWYSYVGGDKLPNIMNKSVTIDVTQSGFYSDDNQTANVNNLLTFTFETQAQSDNIENPGIQSPVAMRLNYCDVNNSEKLHSYFISDITDYLISGDFSAGGTGVVQILVPGIYSSNLESIDLLPYDLADGKMKYYKIEENQRSTIIWGLQRVSVEYGDGEQIDLNYKNNIVSIKVNKLIDSIEGRTIDMKDISLRALISYQGKTGNPIFNVDEEIELKYNPDGEEIVIELEALNSRKGWTTEITDVTARGELTMKTKNGSDEKSDVLKDTITLTVKGDAEVKTEKQITFTSLSNKDKEITITIIMENYKDTYGADPLILNISSEGENYKVISGQKDKGAVDFTPTGNQTINVQAVAGDGISVALSVKQISGTPITYIFTDHKDGTGTIELNGNRTTTDAVFEIQAYYSDDGHKVSVLAEMTIKNLFNSLPWSGVSWMAGKPVNQVAADTPYMTFHYVKGTDAVSGVILAEDVDVKLFVASERDVVIYYETSDGTVLKDMTQYDDVTVTEPESETEPESKKETESEKETEPATEVETESDTAGETEMEADIDPENEEKHLVKAKSILRAPTVILDPDRASVTSNAIVLPSATKEYTFSFKGKISVVHQ